MAYGLSTLEDNLGATDTTIAPRLNAISQAPHWSALRNLSVAADITNAGSLEEFGITRAQTLGAALGIQGAEVFSRVGIFTDRNGNTIVVTQETNPPYPLLKNGLLGPKFYEARLPRNMGEGGAFEANALILTGGRKSYRNYAGWTSPQTVDIGGRRLTYSDAPTLLEQIESIGKLDGVILVNLSGEPFSLSDILPAIIDFVFAIAAPFAPLIGIPPEAVEVIRQSVKQIVSGQPVTLQNLADAASTLAPAEVRQYLDKGKSVYGKLRSGDYAGAAAELGVSDSDQELIRNLQKQNITGILRRAGIDYETTYATLQNTLNIDVIDEVRRKIKSGTLKQQIIDAASATRVPALQNLWIAGGGQTLLGTIPNFNEVAKLIVNETGDVTDVNIHKGLIQAALGYPVGADTFDELLLKTLTEQALKAAEAGENTFVLPVSVPYAKRLILAPEIGKRAGMKVVAGKRGAYDTSLTSWEWY